MAKKITLEQLAADLYEDEEIRQAVLKSVADNKTEERIVRGELTLPSAMDAFHWHRRVTGQAAVDEEKYRSERRIAELEKAVSALSKETDAPSKDYVAKLEKRIKALEKGGE